MKQIAGALAFVLICLIVLQNLQAKRFNEAVKAGFLEQTGIFPYYIQPGTKYTLILGDMNGLNPSAYLALQEYIKKPGKEGEIVIPSVLPQNSKRAMFGLVAQDFYYQVANKKSVVIAHNLCSPSWVKNKDLEIYRNSALSIGAYCQSEPESERLDRIIREYNVKKVILYHDVDSYKVFVGPFLEYLEARGIEYEFKAQ